MWASHVQGHPNLVEEGKLDTTPYDDIVKLVKNYYDPLPSVTMQRYKFNTRVRSASESVANYVASLREIAQYCEYKESLQDMFRDRLVCGVNHEAITNRLLSEKKLTLTRQWIWLKRSSQWSATLNNDKLPSQQARLHK